MSGAALIGAYAADLAFGDPRRAHPVAGFGRLAARVERAVYAPSRARGVGYAAGLVGLAALAGELLARRADLKVLFMSGYTEDAIVHRGVLAPNTAFINKPFSGVNLAAKVREVLYGS